MSSVICCPCDTCSSIVLGGMWNVDVDEGMDVTMHMDTDVNVNLDGDVAVGMGTGMGVGVDADVNAAVDMDGVVVANVGMDVDVHAYVDVDGDLGVDYEHPPINSNCADASLSVPEKAPPQVSFLRLCAGIAYSNLCLTNFGSAYVPCVAFTMADCEKVNRCVPITISMGE